MVIMKWFFNNNCQVVIDTKEPWTFGCDLKGTYFEEGAYKKFFSLGKINIYWCLPTKEEVQEAINMWKKLEKGE